MATNLESLIVKLDANVAGYNRKIDSAQRNTKDSTRKMGRDLNNVEKKTVSLGAAMKNMVGPILAVGAAVAITGTAFIRYADDLNKLQNQLRTVLKPGQDLKEMTQELADVANESRSALAPTINLYARIIRATRELALSTEEVKDITMSLNKAFQISGASTQEAASSVLQLSQAMASGRLAGDEFRAVSESAPIVMDALSASLGRTRGELKDMSRQGKITTEVLIKAIQDYKEKIDNDFAKTVPTVEAAITKIKTNFLLLAGTIDKTIGATDKLIGLFNSMAVAIDNVEEDVTELATALSEIKELLDNMFEEDETEPGGFWSYITPGMDFKLYAELIHWLGEVAKAQNDIRNQEELFKQPPVPPQLSQLETGLNDEGFFSGNMPATEEQFERMKEIFAETKAFGEDLEDDELVRAEIKKEREEAEAERQKEAAATLQASREALAQSQLNDLEDAGDATELDLARKAKAAKKEEQLELEKQNAKSATFFLISKLGKDGARVAEALFHVDQAVASATILIEAAKGGTRTIGQLGYLGIPIAASIIAAGSALSAKAASVSPGDTSLGGVALPTATINTTDFSDIASTEVSSATEGGGASTTTIQFAATAGDDLGEVMTEWLNDNIRKGRIGG